ncbi:MAG: hypothetical protein GXP30_03335 [Verrucomicrobia bacterium]|nr:hypothetical protein [Verrucomicrobiota bacterium]
MSLLPNRKFIQTVTILAVLLLASPASNLFAQKKEGDAARALLAKYKGALVVVTAESKVVTTTDGDPLPTKTQSRRTLGTTVFPNGLIVCSNSALDASVGLVQQKARIPGKDGKAKVVTIASARSEFSKVEISYGDSVVLPGRVVAQRPEIDLAFVLPDQGAAKKLGKTFTAIDLSKFATTAKPADTVVGLSRASAVYSYMPTVIMGHITGVYKGDRTYYVTTAGTAQGIPVFTLDGSPIGVTLERIVKGKRSGILGTLSAGSIQVMANLAMEPPPSAK